jgi:hypothetical protein
MPVKISSRTNAETGEILLKDLQNMKASFINEVKLSRNDTAISHGEFGEVNSQIVKKFSVAVMKEELTQLISHYQANGGIDVIRINIAVHPEKFRACSDTDYSNSLTVVIEAENFKDKSNPGLGTIPCNSDENFVVIPAYNGFPTGTLAEASIACCPSAHP